MSWAQAQQRCPGASTFVSHADEVDVGLKEDWKKQRGKEGMSNGI